MDFTFNSYASILIFCGIITLLFSYNLFGKKGEAVKLFGYMMLSNAIWSLGYGFELASSTLSQMKFFINVEYLGITTLPMNWFLFCLQLAGKDCWYKKKINLVMLLAFSLLTIVLVWTNDYHHLQYRSLNVDHSGPFPMVMITPGIWYRVFTVYFYLLLGLGSYLILVKFRKADPIYRRQNYTIFFAALIPWMTNLAYLLGIRPLENLDLTPFAFIVAIFLIAIAIYRFKLFDILPVAREKVLDLIQDGYLVLDGQNRVIDYNLAVKKYLPNELKDKIIGMQVDQLFPGQEDLLRFITAHSSGKIEMKVQLDKVMFDLEANIMYLNENQLNNEATVVKIQDLTAIREEALRSKLQTEELKKLNQLKDKIFSIIAHDLRGPLVNLSEVLKMVNTGMISLDEFKNLSPKLSRDILYTTDLLENILHWSRSQLKGYGINKTFFELRSMILNEVNYHLPSAAIKKINIVHDVFPGMIVYADMIMIQIVVRNILNNSIKFCREACEIHIGAVYQPDHRMMICIEDNGHGMPPEILASLFTGTGSSTRGTMNEKGTGLGLVICKDFMERNNGEIIVESEIGKGTKFYLYLPVDEG
ncbi:sensor histidine kinase [Pedobacter heparinus]|uniref:histidine kinase n=1 Tax=Pedobacter heparinus (strain ATCC 13125 / DSM 2366 / CIP 104194 / JCM 7457 / NBRC 12017 / NCIMB 9290 / NRRL B-14731 / HIM 762-3) TaxID=485917 RepID=C6Y436_PEDHD|nr:histidine kinase N-terminal 7TM domain-containing protein [Pedobacter heparinus]ACU05479.1 ATP-binding region ATPase domain protein [Pedobacter heparinus DSM 2366]